MLLQVFDGIQTGIEFLVGEQRVDHFVAVEADVDGDLPATTLRLEMVGRSANDIAFTQRAAFEFRSFHLTDGDTENVGMFGCVVGDNHELDE